MVEIPVKNIKVRVHPRLEIWLTGTGICLTLLAACLLAHELFRIAVASLHQHAYVKSAENLVFLEIAGFFIYGNLVYQFTRIGYLKRLFSHRPASGEVLQSLYDGSAPSVTMLIPSYKEEARIVRQALLSTALQEYPNKRVVLLIDDPPYPGHPDDLAGLIASRCLPGELEKLLEAPKRKLEKAFDEFKQRESKAFNFSAESAHLAVLYRTVALWFQEQATSFATTDHTDKWFVERILREPARKYLKRSTELRRLTKKKNTRFEFNRSMAAREYRKLVALFDVKLSSFERKKYANLSHEVNKAMNLNSYIGLMGKSFRKVRRDGQFYLEPAERACADIIVSDADYLITLDADSLLEPSYASHLVHAMEQAGNERCAVIQTPYNAIPAPARVLERIAGATTDIQYIIHQGFTKYRATFWVGANALLRKTALDDICTVVEERGFKIRRYIQDRTVIEDTESTVDLIERGWKLFNYPDRLSYSATPPDFGSLLIQRRRWANGGLIILPKLLRYIFRDRHIYRRLAEGITRLHYLTSLAGVNVGLLLILLYPFQLDTQPLLFLSLLFLVNMFVYGRDLVQSGYRFSDLLRVYALNLMLIPINLGGILKSLHQAFTGKKIPFGRTPKVVGRTAAPVPYILAEFAILGISFISCIVNVILHRWSYAAFSFTNFLFFLYIVEQYMGLAESREDIVGWWSTVRSGQNRQTVRSSPSPSVESE
jgi:cellulose synthase (UDP-forming)